LAPKILGDLVNRVEHLGGRLARPERNPLQMERGLRHLAVGDRRIALLAELDLEDRKLRNLLADPGEALLHVAAKLVGDLQVASPDLDSHAVPFRRVQHSCYACKRRAPSGFLRHAMESDAHPERAKVSARTRSVPHARSARAQAPRVAPVVATSSISRASMGG